MRAAVTMRLLNESPFVFHMPPKQDRVFSVATNAERAE